MNKFERKIAFYDLGVTAMSRTFPAPAIISVGKALELIEQLPEGTRIKAYRGQGEVFYVQRIKIEDGTCHLLINKCDKLASDPVFSDPVNKQWRAATRTADEGLDTSCHIVIKLTQKSGSVGLALVEYVQGMSIVSLQRFMNALLRDAKKLFPNHFRFDHPDGSVDKQGRPKQYTARMLLNFDGHVSDSLESDLSNGTIGDIELITARHAKRALDQQGYVEEIARNLEIRVSDALPRKQRVPLMKSIFKKESINYESARIRFRTADGDARQVTVDTDDFHVGLDAAYVKRRILNGFDDPIPGSCTDFHDPLLEKIVELLG